MIVGEGAIWITEAKEEANLIKVDLKTNQVVATIPLRRLAESPVVGGGFVWLSAYARNSPTHFVWKIDPRTNHVVGKILRSQRDPLLPSGLPQLLTGCSLGARVPFHQFGVPRPTCVRAAVWSASRSCSPPLSLRRIISSVAEFSFLYTKRSSIDLCIQTYQLKEGFSRTWLEHCLSAGLGVRYRSAGKPKWNFRFRSSFP
jgi:hypothetical protein